MTFGLREVEIEAGVELEVSLKLDPGINKARPKN